MTEEEWRTTRDPVAVLEHLHAAGCTSGRKLNLFAVVCCRRMKYLFYDPRHEAAVGVLEGFADGHAGMDELAAAHDGLLDVGSYDPDFSLKADSSEVDLRWVANLAVSQATRVEGAGDIPLRRATAAAHFAVRVGEMTDRYFDAMGSEYIEREWLRRALACVFGDPFRPVGFDPSWRSETAVALAKGIYDDRAFDRLPILADALEEAGCDAADVLNHCRGPGPHARGCWVVDGVLGKE